MEGIGQHIPTLLAAGLALVSLRIYPYSPSSENSVHHEHAKATITEIEDENDDLDTDNTDGSVKPVVVQWRNISCVLMDKAGEVGKTLLKNISGEAKPGRLLAIMGPSGSGKTSLINVLAGQLPASKQMRLNGHLLVNGRPVKNAKHTVAYVRQEDLFFSQLTVRETLSLAAELQLGKDVDKEKYVDDLLKRLGLGGCAGTIVGDKKVRGISGGEKKRLSIACELIASPSVIFADEPTTGLDAFQAEQVMETLRELAHDGHTVICSIHQPRGSIYAKFDDLMLLSNGSLVYMGPAGEKALTYFESIGYKCPEHVNPAEFFADLISIDYSTPEREEITRGKLASLVNTFSGRISESLYGKYESAADNSGVVVRSSSVKLVRPHVGWWKQFRILLRRAWLQATRDGPTNKVRGTMSLSSALIFGSIFWRMGRTQTSIQDRLGLLQVAAVNTAMAALTKTVNVFPKERTIVQQERTKGSYGLIPYLLSKLVAEAPISAAFPLAFAAVVYPMTGLHPTFSRFLRLSGIVTVEAFAASAMGLTVGAIAPTSEAASALGPSIMTVFIVFGGYYVNEENTPLVFRWIPKVSMIRWAFQALCINEFTGLKFLKEKSFDVENGEQALDRLSFGKSSLREAILQEGRIALFWYYLTYFFLKRNKPRYQKFEALPHPTALAECSRASGKSESDFAEDITDAANASADEDQASE
ncbi:ATP-binding cassette, subfamily G (WHITE), member 2 [Marchantia polymorpha subsp. ruderalis]|uniref:ABC transporter domain-containing protein n=2 Tax=Marchantia polymorpha TaxID=3197 RepID=A0AAF6B297_MARPO|nr:hypothetical protein MARPO_0142s0030 [Marchantia polymorpha]PTQ29403.1 hypothetical protein MARPO_0142s0030 [Marchantia polymorpha]BBN06130.1 hypothetical protein Mp_3g18640 [Marchantia polymorpha subsp. ruderalis]BBN06131.1 hypothetical protein Mp_3g18640 [Marchantia polymorpha subsp. ruderalis]|eukprot:PTQ29402.1 hypothetical protein MARPO_0142s0030 [Marchantia polymorpha]